VSEGEEKYLNIIEYSPVSLWAEDISKLRLRLGELKKGRGFNLRNHLAAHPEFVQEAVGLIEVADVNQATLRLFEADRKEQLLGPLNTVLDPIATGAFKEIILAIDDGRSDVESESSGVTLCGKKLCLIAKSHIPALDAAYPFMLVSLVDITARKQSEERERLSSSILRSMIESAPDAIFVKDRSLRMVLCNTVHSRAVGKKPDDTCGKTDIENGWSVELVKGNPEKMIEGWEKDDLAALSGETIQKSDVPQNVGNEIRYFNTVKMPLRDQDGAVIGVIGIGFDITDRRRIEQDLAWERSLLTALMENLPDYVYFKDRASTFTRVSRSHARALGLKDPSEAIGKTDADFFSEVHAQKALADEQQTMKTGNPMLDSEEQETREGQPDAWVITSKIPLISPQGDIIGTFGISHDITERKKLEAKNQELAILVESSDDAIVGTDLERRITVWNKGAERIYGYSAEEMIGTIISPLIPADCEEETRIVRERVMQGEQATNFETIRLRKDGSRITVSMTLSAICTPEGKIVGMASTARDVTAQKAIEQQLNRVKRLESLAILAGGIAHQFNNINTITKGYLDLIRSHEGLPVRSKSYVEAALVGVQKAVDITDRLLMLTDPRPAISTTIRFDVLASTMAALQEKRMEEENVRLVLELADTPPVAADESRLKFVLSSLIGNAIDSLLGRPVRTLTIRTGSTKDGSYFEVKDSGCGIPEADLPKLFMPFYSAKGEWAPPGSPQAKLKGVGLSLAVSNMSVSEYGGRIDVRSTEGVGSTFRVVLPTQGRST
jgi:PAS domain S-box-containing protein